MGFVDLGKNALILVLSAFKRFPAKLGRDSGAAPLRASQALLRAVSGTDMASREALKTWVFFGGGSDIDSI